MGKRKYDSEVKEASKKSKGNENLEGVEDVELNQPQNENKSLRKNDFDMKQFRKELATRQGQTIVLNQFLNVCLNPDQEVDYIMEYLKVGGNSHEILRQISQDNKKNLTLATPAFHLFHLIILKVQSSLPHMITVTEEACRYFLNTFIPTVEIMISENSGPRHRKIILKLLTSMVTLNSDLGVEILNQVPLTPKHLQYVCEKPNYKEKDNVRTAFVHFITSFLVDGHLPLIKALLEKQGLLGLVIPGLVNDEAEAVMMFFNILKTNVIENPLLSKTLKLKTFSQQVLYNIFKVFAWKGPPEISNELRNTLRPEIMTVLSDIILTLFTSHRLGLYFVDHYLGTGDTNKNQNLYKALLSLKRPWENENECQVILQIIYKCPDLHRAIINVVEPSFQPQHSPIWEKAAEFVIKLLDKLKPDEMVHRMSKLTPLQTANFVRFVTMPVPLLKHLNTTIGNDKTISLYCARVLVKMLSMLKRYMQILDVDDSNLLILELKNKLEYFLPKHVPAPTSIALLIQDIINDAEDNSEVTQDYQLPKINKSDSLLILIDLLMLYNDIHASFFESLDGHLNMKHILDYSTKISSNDTSLLKFKIVSLWLMLDSSAVSIRNPMFKELFQIMLDVYTNENDNTWIEAKDTLYVFLKNTTIFEGDEDEIHIILHTLRNIEVNPISLIADVVEYVIANKNDLSEVIRKQIVYFEISDADKEENLDNLFNDLMKNKSTEDCVYLESKVPSPFIVGCMQYTQNNKEAKKSLKHFLSLYVANLLHCNHSPELTEILIGDSKLDVRNYVASWVGEPITIPETIVGKDHCFWNLSRSVIGNEDFALHDIFDFLKECSEEEKDFEISKVSYKIAGTIDSSELVMWSKYITFCLVKLANMNKLTQVQRNKLEIYFNCIIAIVRKSHMVHICRNIIMNLFKNSHVLKIFTPVDWCKNESNVLATDFILRVINNHSDIVTNLDKKQNILKPYKMKNYKEIMKAFVKITKKKKLKCEHTVNILKVIGLRQEDDHLILDQIWNAEINSCIKDDKEPSIMLEVLAILVEKYSKSINIDLPQGVLEKSFALYTQLLKCTDVTPNLTVLEDSFIKYIENKPHHVSVLSNEAFKAFFYANALRKTTSRLAATLLKINVKLCDVFKEEIKRNEILSQRELTLPLGNAIINHARFVADNKELLSTIYDEYKSNINKYLEKPHKVGQIYLLCWKFIRKLIAECMDVKDCEKIFSKSHKFETVDLSHVELLHEVFWKISSFSSDFNKNYIINYFLSMFHLLTNAIKDSAEKSTIDSVVSNIQRVIYVCKCSQKVDLERKDDFKKITESSIWQNYCKAVLKDSLKIKTANQIDSSGPQLLRSLIALVKLFYPDDHEDIVILFDMVTSHSEFLNVMLSHHSPDIKSRLLEFLHVLTATNKSVMKSQQIPVYLSSYRATRSSCDRIILSILYLYESNGQPVNEYKPYVWGDSAANHYAVRKNRTSTLWGHPTPNQVLNLFEKDVIERTIKNFPVTQKLDYTYELPSIFNDFTQDGVKKAIDDVNNEFRDKSSVLEDFIKKDNTEKLMTKMKDTDVTCISHLDHVEDIYDPVFVLSLLSHLLAPGSVASCFKLMRTGLLSLPIMALSSHCPMMRAAAYHVLHRFSMLLETETKHKNDKLLLTDFITTLRNSLSAAITTPANGSGDVLDMKNPRLPTIGALYLANALMVATAPFDPLYRPVNNFLIAKQFVDVTIVPDFLSLFHDSDVECVDRRLWILDVIKDGTKTMTDVNVIFKSMCLKMIMDFYSTVLCDRKTKERILYALSSIIAVPRAFEILVEGYGFLSWLHFTVRQIEKEDKSVVIAMLTLLRNMLYSLRITSLNKNIHKHNGRTDAKTDTKTYIDMEYKILLLLYELTKWLEGLEFEDAVGYFKIYKLFSRRTMKFLNKKQVLNLVNKCASRLTCANNIESLTRAVITNNSAILKSKNVGIEDNGTPEECLIIELIGILQTYLL